MFYYVIPQDKYLTNKNKKSQVLDYNIITLGRLVVDSYDNMLFQIFHRDLSKVILNSNNLKTSISVASIMFCMISLTIHNYILIRRIL